jgi:hypothetical protein
MAGKLGLDQRTWRGSWGWISAHGGEAGVGSAHMAGKLGVAPRGGVEVRRCAAGPLDPSF